jgi:phage major head subunit gpT-like protein
VPKFDLEDIKAAYSEHLADIEAKAADYEDKIASGELAKIRAAGMKTARDLKAKALKERWPGSRLEVELIKATSAYEVELIRAERPKGPAIHSSSRDMTAPVIEAALCKSAGLPNIEKHFKEEVLEASDKSFRNMSLQECILIQAQANGYSGRAFRIHDGNLRDVMRHAFAADIRAGFSTVSLPGIFSNVANKFLLDGWNSVEQTWRSICRIRSVTDFKAVTSYRLTGDMKYEKVTNDGKLKHGKVGEESYTISADTFGKIFSLTRKDMINDDLGAFDTIRQKLGRGGALKLVEEFWKEFMDNAAFFTAARGNYLTGADTPLAIASLSAAVTAFRKLKDSDGNPLGVTPAILLTPPDNSVTADQIYQSTNLNTGGAATTAMVPDANVHRGKYQPQSSAYLSNSNFTGYSTLAWYLLASPADMPVMEGAFLNGQESPTIESAEADFATLGVDFRGYHDFGFAKKEYLGGIKIKGAA